MINMLFRYRDGTLGVTDSPTPTLSLTNLNDALRVMDPSVSRLSQNNINDYTNSSDPNVTNSNSFCSVIMNQNPSYGHLDNHIVSSDIYSSEHKSSPAAVYSPVIKEECKSPTALESFT